jgi:hypothetical protein
MALFLINSRPGSKQGPCLAQCGHKLCAEIRARAFTPCYLCGKAIGYDTGFYDVGNSGPFAHGTCYEANVEKLEEERDAH